MFLYIPHVVQYIFIAYFTHNSLYFLVFLPHISPPTLVTASLFPVAMSLPLFYIMHFFMFICLLYFLDSTYKSYQTVFVFLCLTYFTWHIYPPMTILKSSSIGCTFQM